MLHIEPVNRLVKEVVVKSFNKHLEGAKSEPTNVRCCDYDGVGYHILVDSTDTKKVLRVSIVIMCFDELAQYGAVEAGKSIYGNLVAANPEGYDFTLEVDLDELPESEEARDELATKIALMKRHLMAAAFRQGFTNFRAQKFDVLSLPYRDDEIMYIRPQKDSCAIIFSLHFETEDDVAFARVFMQEFADARRDPALRSAPAVAFSYGTKPLELQNVDVNNEQNTGFITFALFERHFDNDQHTDNTIDLIHQFRTYLHYHMKCSHAYLHSRMRKKYTEFLQILNRAKPGAGEMKGPGLKGASGKFLKRPV